MKMMNRVIVTKMFVGICHMQVCAEHDATDDEILAVANAENPSGTTAGWGAVVRDGEGAPVQCKDYANRKHFLCAC